MDQSHGWSESQIGGPAALPASFWRGTLSRLLRYGLLLALIFRLLVLTIYTLLLSPLALWVVDAFVGLSGSAIVANFGLIGFIRSPFGIALSILGLIAVVWAELFQLAAFSVINVRALAHRPTSLFGIFHVLVAYAGALLGAALALAAVAIVVALPLAAAAGLTYWLLLTGADINFFLAARPPRFQAAVGIGSVLIALALLAWAIAQVRLIMVVPIVMFEGKRGFDALRASNAMVRGHGWRILRALLSWLGVVFALLIVVSLIASAVVALVAPAPGASLRAISIAFAAMFVVSTLAAAFQAFVSPFLYAALNVHLYADLRARQGLPALPELTRVPNPNARRVSNRKLRTGLFVAAALFMLAVSVLVGLGAQALAARPAIAIIAHRAGAAGAPENSLTALRRTIDQRIAAYAEIDVQETADGVVVVVHDSDLRRLANVDARVWDLTLAQVEQADIGKNVGPQFAGERIPTFDAFLDAAKGNIKLNIELKYDRAAPLLAGKVVRQVRAKGMQNEVVISSLSAEGLAQVRQLAPELRLGFIYAFEIGSLARLDVDFLEPDESQVTASLLRAANTRGLPVFAWTIDDAASARHMYDLGVSAVITNEPPLVERALAERDALSDQELIMLRFRQLLEP